MSPVQVGRCGDIPGMRAAPRCAGTGNQDSGAAGRQDGL